MNVCPRRWFVVVWCLTALVAGAVLCVAPLLAARPKVLLLDEPAAGMNPQEEQELLELLRTAREWVPTIVLVEHHMRVVMRFAKRILVMNSGRRLAEGPPEVIQNHPEVIAAYLGGEVGSDE